MNIVCGGFITLCWLIYVIYWFARSFSQKSASEKPEAAINYIDKFFSFAAIVILIKPDWFYLSATVVKNSWASGIASMVICALGLVVCVWARENLAGNWCFTLDFKTGHELIQSGPYEYVRHPIYSGILLMFLGSALAMGKLGGFIGFAIFLVKFLLRIPREENLMARHFPAEYQEYKNNTKALVPFLW